MVNSYPENIISMLSADQSASFSAENIISELTKDPTVMLLIGACLLTLLAFEGYRLFKMIVYIGSAFLFGYIGYTQLAPALAPQLESVIPEMINLNGLVAIVCALLAVFLARCAYQFMILLLGAASGYLVGTVFVYQFIVGYFSTLDFLKTEIASYIIGGVIASIFAILFVLIFKHIFMIATAFGGMVGAALLVQEILVPGDDQTIMICFVVLGVAVGVFAVVHQYREEEKSMEIVF